MQKAAFMNNRRRTVDWGALSNWAPILGLALLALLFFVVTEGSIFGAINLKNLTSQVLVTALVGLGAVFVFSAGAFDMSLSGSLCLTAIIGAKVAMATGSIGATLAACLLVSLAQGVVKGLLAAYLDAPFFIVTIVIGALLTALGLLIMGKETVLTITNLPTIDDMTLINVMTLGGFFLLALVLFDYTQIGKSCRLIGGNAVAALQSGVAIERTKLIAFLVSALSVALAAFIILLRTRTASPTTGGSTGIDVIVALVLGGMALSGGPRSKVSAAVVGAATITVLNSGLVIVGVGPGLIQIVRGVIFLVVVWIASLNHRTGLLPR
jgi:ribose transport system permease protein